MIISRDNRNHADALHLSIPAQGLPNGDATLQHATYPGMQPYPGVGTYITLFVDFFFFYLFFFWLSNQNEQNKKNASCLFTAPNNVQAVVVRWNGYSNETYKTIFCSF